MAHRLFVRDTPKVAKQMGRLAFRQTPKGLYQLDAFIMQHLDIQEECPQGYRPVAVHILPYTMVEDEHVYYAFNSLGAPTLYVSFQITPEDFVAASETDPYMSLPRSIVGKIVRTLDAPHIDIALDMERFGFPAVVNGEFIWAMEVQGDDNHTVDELVGQLGTVVGRITKEQVLNKDIEVNALSLAAIEYKAPKSDLTI